MASEKFELDRNNLESNLRLWLQQHPKGGYIQLEGNTLVISDKTTGQPPKKAGPTKKMSRELIEQLKQCLLEHHNEIRSAQLAYAYMGGEIHESSLTINHVLSGLTNLTAENYAILEELLERLKENVAA